MACFLKRACLPPDILVIPCRPDTNLLSIYSSDRMIVCMHALAWAWYWNTHHYNVHNIALGARSLRRVNLHMSQSAYYSACNSVDTTCGCLPTWLSGRCDLSRDALAIMCTAARVYCFIKVRHGRHTVWCTLQCWFQKWYSGWLQIFNAYVFACACMPGNREYVGRGNGAGWRLTKGSERKNQAGTLHI